MNGIRVSLLALTLSVCHAENILSVRGNVEINNSTLDSPLMVVLESSDPWKVGLESSVGADGSFEFRDVSPGMHRLRLTTQIGETINEELVNVNSSRPISIRLPVRTPAKPVSGLVSAHRLLHPTPKKAMRALADAQKESKKGRADEAIAKLKLALSLDPDYFEAYCNLGVQYKRLGRRAEAAVQFEKAASIAPPDAQLYGNLAVTYFVLGKKEEAVDSAKRTLELDKAHPAAHYVLGSLLARDVTATSLGNAQEAVNHLRQGEPVSPRVHMEIARIEEASGDRAGAIEEVHLYLKSGDTAYRAAAERWLANY